MASERQEWVGDSSGRDPVEELAEEFLEKQRRGEHVEISEYTKRYPELAERIREVFPALLTLERLGRRQDDEGGGAWSDAEPLGLRRIGEYKLVREIGRGGMGIVYEAEQESLGRRVALKVLPQHALLRRAHRERFHREAQAAARLQHPNIVPVFGVGEEGGVHFYTMQVIHGESLDQVIVELRALRTDGNESPRDSTDSIAAKLLSGALETGKCPRSSGHEAVHERGALEPHALPGERGSRQPPSSSLSLVATETGRSGSRPSRQQYFTSVAGLGVQVAHALAYAHGEGVLHRDIKPSNLLLDVHGTAWITDFGLAKAEGSDSLTQEGDVVGTLVYMAPERLDGWADPRSDVYGLGVTLYELLTLRPPFDGSDRRELLKKVTQEEPRRPSRLEPRLPRDLETIVLKSIEKDPERRYRSAEAMGVDLERFLRGEPIEARPTTIAGRLVKWARRRPAAAAAILLLILLTAAAGSIARTAHLAREARLRARYENRVVEAIVESERGRGGWTAPASQLREPIEPVLEEDGSLLPAAEAADWSTGSDPRHRALEVLEEAIDLFPREPDAWFQRAKVHHLLEDDRAALADLAEALRVDPDFQPAVILRRSIEASGKPGAHGGAEDGGAAPSPWASAWEQVYATSEKEEWREEAAAWTELIGLGSRGGERYLGESLKLRLGRGRCRLRLGDYPGALEDFSKAAERWPDVMEPVLLQATTWHLLGKPERAAAVLAGFHARAQDPASFALEAARLWGERLHERGRTLPWLEKARPGLERELLRGKSLLGLGEVEEAEKAAEKALALAPDSFDAVFLRGRVHKARKEMGRARAMFERAVALDETRCSGHEALGQAFRELGEKRRALASFRAASKIHPENASHLFHTAYALNVLHEHEESLQLYRRLLELVEEGPSANQSFEYLARNNMASILRREERYAEAIAEALRALRINPRSPFTIRILLDALDDHVVELERAGDTEPPEPLVEAADEAARLIGDRVPRFLALSGRVRGLAGDLSGAVRDLERAFRLGHSAEEDLRRLSEWREALRPDLASYESSDAALEPVAAGSTEERALLEAFDGLECDGRRLALRAYLEGRVLERRGRFDEAARCFIEAIAAGEARPAPCLHLARSLEAAGRAAEAETWLHHLFRKDAVVRDEELRDIWLRVTLGRLGWKPSQVLARLPVEVPETPAWRETAFALETLAGHGDLPVERSRLIATTGRSVSSRLYAAALEALSPGLWDDLSRRVESGAVSRTFAAGGGGGHTFEEIAREGALLTGFRVALIPFAGRETVGNLQPLFLARRGSFAGQPSGDKSARSSVDLVAPPGYAVGAVRLGGRERIQSIQVIFMRARSGGDRPTLLDPGQSYRTHRFGTSGEGRMHTLDGRGHPIAGIFGRRDREGVHSLGLVLGSSRPVEDRAVGSALTVLDSLDPGSGKRRAILQALVELARTGSRDGLEAAIEGRGGRRDDRFDEMARAFLESIAAGEPHPAPSLHLAESLDAAGETALAEAWLRHLLTRGAVTDPEILDLWLRVAMGGLGWKPSEILARFPSDARGTPAPQEATFALRTLAERGDGPVEREVFTAARERSASSLLYAAALEARSPGLWSMLSNLVGSGQTFRTREVDGKGGGSFEDVPLEGALLTGFRLRLCVYEGDVILNTLEPHFLGRTGRFMGQRNGDPNATCQAPPSRVFAARPGYAVAGIVLSGGSRVRDFQVIFMRIREGPAGRRSFLDPEDSYRSPGIGVPGEREVTELGGDGEAVVGLFGRRGHDVDSLGLVLTRTRLRDPAEVDAALARALPLVTRGAIWRRHASGDSKQPADWTRPEFDDRSWTRVHAKDYGREDGARPVLLRRSFPVERPEILAGLVLSIEAEDHVEVFLNGGRVHEVRLEDPDTWMPYETRVPTRPRRLGEPLLRLAIPLAVEDLRKGDNVLAAETSSPRRHRISLDGRRAPGALTPRLEVFLEAAGEGRERTIARYLEGRLLQERGELEPAIDRFEAARSAREAWLEPMLRSAECHLGAGRPDAAESVLLEAVDGALLGRDAERFDRWLGLVFEASERSARDVLELLESRQGETIADSRTGWSSSGTQGDRGWFHGYYSLTRDGDRTYQPGDFTAFRPSHWTGTRWDLRPVASPWTMIGYEHTHPNGTNSDAGEEHWTIRRWVSDRSGDVAITWHMRKTRLGGNGVSGKLFLDGVEVDSATISGTDGAGFTRAVTAELSVGSRIDLALTPNGADGTDHAATWLRVSKRDKGEMTALAGPTSPADPLLAPLRQLVTSGVLRINCGRPSESVVTASGELWLADRSYQGGRFGSGSDLEVSNPRVLRYERRYLPGESPRFAAYRIPLPDGRYRITLHYAEAAFPEPASRLFDTLIEDLPVQVNFEPGAGGFGRLRVASFATSVQDGLLDLEFRSRLQNPMINGIEIRRIGENGEADDGTRGTPSETPLRGDRDERYFRALRLYHLGRQLVHRGRDEEAAGAFRRSIAVLRELATEGYRPRLCRRVLGPTYSELARLLVRLDRTDEADRASEHAAIYSAFTDHAAVDEAIERGLGVEVTLVPAGARWRFRRGTAPPPADWAAPGFDDGAWKEEESGFGYGDGDDTTVLNEMRYRYTTVYIRRVFDVPSPRALAELELHVDYDDGFVAFLNGTEVARRGLGPEGSFVTFDALANAKREAGQAETIDLSPFLGLMDEGPNVLAIQGANESIDSSDFSLIPVVRATLERDLLGPVRAAGLSAEAGRLLPYLEGRTHQQQGNLRKAIAVFEDLVERAGNDVEPALRLAECLTAAGETARARRVLEELLERRRDAPLVAWRLWNVTGAAAALDFDVEKAAAILPLDATASLDIVWALRQLRDAGVVRINCGGPRFVSPQGATWGRDRFFASGAPGKELFQGEIAGTEDDALFRTERFFRAPHTAYRIPLPPGHYRATLHFAEVHFEEPGRRRFDVLVEGAVHRERYEPPVHSADRIVVDGLEVTDGFLEIGFRDRIENPKVSAIEVIELP